MVVHFAINFLFFYFLVIRQLLTFQVRSDIFLQNLELNLSCSVLRPVFISLSNNKLQKRKTKKKNFVLKQRGYQVSLVTAEVTHFTEMIFVS